MFRSAMLAGATLAFCGVSASAQVRTGEAAFGDWKTDSPGVVRKITPADLPRPLATPPSAQPSALVKRAAGALPKAPPGFTVTAFADLEAPRQIRVAPNGDIFVAETDGRAHPRAARRRRAPPRRNAATVFAAGLDEPFGIAFYPPTRDPKWVYVANTNSVVRFAYNAGDLKARGAPETIVPQLAASTGGHTTRDIAFSADGKPCWSRSVRDPTSPTACPGRRPTETAAWAKDHAAGRRLGPRGAAAPTSRLLSGRQRQERLRHRHPQLRQPDRASHHRRALVRDQRARQPGRRPAARLRHPRERQGLLRLALVLHRRPRGSAPEGRTARPRRQGHRARRADPAPFRPARHDLLRAATGVAAFPAELPRRRFRRRCTAPGTARSAPATRWSG